MNVLSLFDGISCCQLALRKSKIKYEIYFASEIDKYAVTIAQANFPDTIQLGDVQYSQASKLPPIDLLAGGSPCQGFSFAGKQKNFKDERSNLFFEFKRLLDECNPRYFFFENVNMIKESLDIISDCLGVKPIKINSDLFVCQNRVRNYWTNIPILALPERPLWNENYYSRRRDSQIVANKSGVSPCLTAAMGTGGHNVPLKSKNLKDRLSPLDCERLQGIPDNYTDHVSTSQRYKAIGNGWTIDVVSHIFNGMTL